MLALVVAIPIASGKPALPALSNNSQTLGELGAEWWKWALEEPASTYPAQDADTASQCEGYTTYAKREVFFLAGTQSGNPVQRECTVSHKTWIFLPVVNNVDVEPIGALTEDEIRTIVNEQMDQFLMGVTSQDLYVTVDGEPVPVSIQKNRADTPLFTVNLPKDNIFGAAAPEGEYEAVADGVWVLLRPLKKGEHTITFGGTFNGFEQDNTYILTVV